MMRRGALLIVVAALLGALFMVLPSRHPGRTVRMEGARFSPQSVRIAPGQAVTFDNASTTTHTATCVNCPIDIGDVQPGLAKTATFRRAGTYTFLCRYHGSRGMRMTVVVGSGGDGIRATPAPGG